MDSTPTTPRLPGIDYEARARKCFEAVKLFKKLHLRLVQAAPSLAPNERRDASETFDPAAPRYTTKTEKLDRTIAKLYAQRWTEDAGKIFEDRKVTVARTLSELFELIDKLSSKL